MESKFYRKKTSQGDLVINSPPGWSWWVTTHQAYTFFSKCLISALGKPCPLFLCLQVNGPLLLVRA